MLQSTIIVLLAVTTVFAVPHTRFEDEVYEFDPENSDIGQNELVETPNENSEENEVGNGNCPLGMVYGVQNHCFEFSKANLNWFEAMSFCELDSKPQWNNQNGWVAQISGQAELNFLKQHACYNEEYWLGATNILPAGQWYWYHWMPVNNWYNSCPPANYGTQCLYLKNGQLKGGSCYSRRGFICERRRGQ